MLELQKYLHNGKSPQDLKDELGIMIYYHPTLPLVGFKYNQINSPKLHQIVRECRGIVLEKDTWNLVAKGFNRFFNLGEVPEEDAAFDWNNCKFTEKMDGSLILLYNYKGRWLVNTSGSFGLGICGESGITWTELFWQNAGIRVANLNPDYTYVFELCTKWNVVVVNYPKDIVYALSAFRGEEELSHDEFLQLTWDSGYIPSVMHAQSTQEILKIFERKNKEGMWEGLVGRDKNNNRFKVKGDPYLVSHHFKGEGFTVKRMIPIILANETDEILSKWIQYKPQIDEITLKLEKWFTSLLTLHYQTAEIPDQKDFALSIVGKNPFVGLLFTLRKAMGPVYSPQKLRELWCESSDLIVKYWKDY